MRYCGYFFLAEVPVFDPVCDPSSVLSARCQRLTTLTTSAPTAAGQGLRRRIERAIYEVFGLAAKDLHGSRRGPARIAFARQCAIYVARVSFGLSYSKAGRMFGRDRTTAAHACKVVEDRRDDPEADAILRLIECLAREDSVASPLQETSQEICA